MSIASLREIAIAYRLGKPDPRRPPEEIEPFCERSGLSNFPITTPHVIATVDRSLATHPLALKT